jgi:MFS family permease
LPDEGATGSVLFLCREQGCLGAGGLPILGGVRRLLALVSAIVFVDAMLFSALTPLVPGYAEEFGLSKSGAGLLVAAFGAGALLGGVPGGLAAARFGPKRAVVTGLVLLGVASFAFAAADDATTLGLARFVQGFSSTVTWAGALAWVAAASAREQRGEVIGTAFGAAVFGAILGPMFGGLAEELGIRGSFVTVGVIALAFAALASVAQASRSEKLAARELVKALRDPRFVGGLWLNTLPALLFGILIVLAPLALDEQGWSTLAIAAVFFAAGVFEVILNPVLGRMTDRVGLLLPIRAALAASVVVAVALAASSEAVLIALLVGAAAISFGALYTPGMTLTSHRADASGLAQGLAFGIMNSAWALGALAGPSLGGALGDAFGDPAPYLAAAGLCALTLAAAQRVAVQRARPHAA